MAKDKTKDAVAIYQLVIGGVEIDPKQGFTADADLVDQLIADGCAALKVDQANPVHIDATVGPEGPDTAP